MKTKFLNPTGKDDCDEKFKSIIKVVAPLSEQVSRANTKFPPVINR